MKVGREFVDYLQDLFGVLGVVRVRPMFGGAGIYIDELMFGFLDRDESIYLRADDETRPAFEAVGSAPFRYPLKTGEEFEIGYWRMPDEALESPEEAAGWGRLALDAALRKMAAKPKSRKSR
jgi:DNA transformation protein